jgi:creatinine amidohydrolase
MRAKVEWAAHTAPALRRFAETNAVAIVPVASTEQHGPHLPVQVDSLLCAEIAIRAAALLGEGKAVVLPAVWTGLAEHHMSFGGTITLDFATFSGLVGKIVESLIRQGFRRIFLLNGHGGNSAALQTIVAELAVAHRLPIAAATYWEVAGARFAEILQTQSTVRHACEAETSMVLALRPDLVDMDRIAEAHGPDDPAGDGPAAPGVYRWRSYASRTKSGVIGNAGAATAEKGRSLLDAAAEELAALFSAGKLWDVRS